VLAVDGSQGILGRGTGLTDQTKDLTATRRNEATRALGLSALDSVFTSGRVVMFAGHGLDHPDNKGDEVLPPHLERALYVQIEAQVVALKAAVAYTMLGAGSGILFAEACIEKNVALHVVIPFHLEDYVIVSVTYGEHSMRKWHARMKRILNHPATRVVSACFWCCVCV
jgi:hypothetical protein